MKEKGLLSEIDEEESTALFNILIEKAEAAGFIHYEISNFGKPGSFQYIIPITGNRLIILDLALLPIHLMVIHGNGISAI